MLSSSDKNYRRISSGYCGKSTSSLCMTIQFCNYNRAYFYRVLKSQGLVVTSRANRRVHDKNTFIGIDTFFNSFHFIEQSTFLFMSTRSIDYYQVKVFFLKQCHSFFSNLNWIRFCIRTIKWNPYL